MSLFMFSHVRDLLQALSHTISLFEVIWLCCAILYYKIFNIDVEKSEACDIMTHFFIFLSFPVIFFFIIIFLSLSEGSTFNYLVFRAL